MIEINLAPGPKKKKSAGPSIAFSLDDLKAYVAKVKDPFLVGAISGVAIGIAAIAFMFLTMSASTSSAQEELTRVQNESRRFSALLAQKRSAEALRDSLIRELDAIRGIDGQRFVWPHILEEVTRALPDYTWLVGLEPLGGGGPAAGGGAGGAAAPADSAAPVAGIRFQIEGRTSDIQAYTRFLRQLAESPWITNIVAGPTNTAVEQDRAVTAFTLTAAFRRADSAFVRTAPLIQTLQ